MNMSAFGTLWSPMCMTDEPTHEPMLRWARLRIACIMRDVLGAAWTRLRPWPVSRRRYGTFSESRSDSARYHRWNMSMHHKKPCQFIIGEAREFKDAPCKISRHNVKL